MYSILPPLLLLPACLARSLYSSKPANASDILRTAYPVGNGRLAVLPFGEPGHEVLSINRDSLWTGGPFENSSYNGGNNVSLATQRLNYGTGQLTHYNSASQGQRYQHLPGIRDWIWTNGTGNVSQLMGDNDNYGSYAVLGNLSIHMNGLEGFGNYARTLDLETGLHKIGYEAGDSSYNM